MPKKISDIAFPKREPREKVIEKILEKKHPSKKPSLLIASFVLLIFFFFVLAWLYPEVTVRIEPEIKEKSWDYEIFLSKDKEGIDFEKMEIPAKIIQKREVFSDEFLATGEVLKEEKAQGTVRIFNNSQKDQILVAGTRLQPPQEKFKMELGPNENPWFRTKERVIVPAKGFIDVKVEADSPGEKYNIEPSFFSIPGLVGTPQYSLIYGQSFEPMKGGMIRKVSQVKKEDLLNAEKVLKEKAEKNFIEILNRELSGIFELLEPPLCEIVETKSSAKEGEEIEKFIFQVVIEGKVMAFSKEDLKSVIQKLVFKEIEPNEEPLEKTLTFQVVEKNLNLNEGKGKIKVRANLKVYWRIPNEILQKSLVGKELKEAIVLLEDQPQIKRVKIHSFPFWLSKFPSDFTRINVIWQTPVD